MQIVGYLYMYVCYMHHVLKVILVSCPAKEEKELPSSFSWSVCFCIYSEVKVEHDSDVYIMYMYMSVECMCEFS